MTLENFHYRTNPLFLRNQFSGQADVFGIPIVPKPHFSHEELKNLRLLGFDQIKRDEAGHRNRMVHFFLYDYKFEKVWDNPESFVELLRRIEPGYVICYSEPFPEMEGNIIFVDYDLSSWKHMEDDIVPAELIKHTHPILTKPPVYDRIIKTGHVCKGGGSAYGGEWQPKDENSKRFLGEPNTTKRSTVKTQKGEYEVETRYGPDGRATHERHYTDHSQPHHHTNPHDHDINLDNGVPTLIRVLKGVSYDIYFSPKSFHLKGASIMPINPDYNPEDHKFETLGEFKFYLSCGANVAFEFHGIEYGVEKIGDGFCIWICNGDVLVENITLEDVMNYELDGVKIRDLILDADITERIM